MSSDQNPKKDSASSNSNASKKGAKGGRKRKRHRGGGKGGGKRQGKSFQIDNEAILRANERFDRNPPAMGLPKKMDPAPKKIKVNWKLKPVSHRIEREVHDIVCRPGEFGFLDDERVDEIAELLGDRPISLEQALSLRSALNQEKAVLAMEDCRGEREKCYVNTKAEKVFFPSPSAMISLQSTCLGPFYLQGIGRKIESKKLCASPTGN